MSTSLAVCVSFSVPGGLLPDLLRKHRGMRPLWASRGFAVTEWLSPGGDATGSL